MKNKEILALEKYYERCFGISSYNFLCIRPFDNCEYPTDVNLLICQTKPECDYDIIATVGLSDLNLEGEIKHAELVCLVEKSWKFNIINKKYTWIYDAIRMIASQPFYTDNTLSNGQIVMANTDFTNYSDCDAYLLINKSVFKQKMETKIGFTKKVKILSIVPLTTSELKLAKRIGGESFLQQKMEKVGESCFIVTNK